MRSKLRIMKHVSMKWKRKEKGRIVTLSTSSVGSKQITWSFKKSTHHISVQGIHHLNMGILPICFPKVSFVCFDSCREWLFIIFDRHVDKYYWQCQNWIYGVEVEDEQEKCNQITKLNVLRHSFVNTNQEIYHVICDSLFYLIVFFHLFPKSAVIAPVPYPLISFTLISFLWQTIRKARRYKMPAGLVLKVFPSFRMAMLNGKRMMAKRTLFQHSWLKISRAKKKHMTEKFNCNSWEVQPGWVLLYLVLRHMCPSCVLLIEFLCGVRVSYIFLYLFRIFPFYICVDILSVFFPWLSFDYLLIR